jgi:hypothetical protein
MLFIQSNLERVVQVGDKTRLDFTKTFTPDGHPINDLTVEPEPGEVFDIKQNKYIDYVFETAGTKSIEVIGVCQHETTVKTVTIDVVTEADDKLFSTDKDIISHEVDIYRFLRPGRSTFLDFHRIAQRMILDDLDQRGLTDNQGNKLTKADILDVQEVAEWSRYLTLYLIFVSVQSEVDDVYATKAQGYKEMAARNASRAFLRLDLDGDGVEDRRQNLISTMRVRR